LVFKGLVVRLFLIVIKSNIKVFFLQFKEKDKLILLQAI